MCTCKLTFVTQLLKELNLTVLKNSTHLSFIYQSGGHQVSWKMERNSTTVTDVAQVRAEVQGDPSREGLLPQNEGTHRKVSFRTRWGGQQDMHAQLVEELNEILIPPKHPFQGALFIFFFYSWKRQHRESLAEKFLCNTACSTGKKTCGFWGASGEQGHLQRTSTILCSGISAQKVFRSTSAAGEAWVLVDFQV